MGTSQTLLAAVVLVAAGTVAAARPAADAQAPMAGRTLTQEEITELAKTMPEGPDRELTVRVCAACHEPQRAASIRLTREGWEEVVAKMVGLGAKATDEELAKVIDYLAVNYKGEAAKPINMNTASAVELESVAGLLRKEAALWIKFRNDTPCKSIDDLKKVPGFPFAKADSRRDRLVCF
jgi:competence protein ComEA